MEEYYLTLSSDGDMHARDVLIEHNLRLVVFLAKKYENTNVDLEKTKQEKAEEMLNKCIKICIEFCIEINEFEYLFKL